MNEEIYNDYLKLSGEIAESLDNTITYENWLIIQEYIDILIKENKQLKEQLEASEKARKKAIEVIKDHNDRVGNLYYKYDNKYLLSEIKEDLLNIIGE